MRRRLQTALASLTIVTGLGAAEAQTVDRLPGERLLSVIEKVPFAAARTWRSSPWAW
jgi:hypothetical protein